MIDLSQIEITTEKETLDFGRFIIEPLDQGFGHTLGNSLRRTLLGSLPGAAITMRPSVRRRGRPCQSSAHAEAHAVDGQYRGRPDPAPH